MTIGIVGAGQLGQMLALAGYPLGLDFLFLDSSTDTPGGRVARTLTGKFTDRSLLRKLAKNSEVVTFDWENVSVQSLRGLGTRVAPPLAALATSQDRIAEKRLFERLKIPTTRYAAVNSARALTAAIKRIGLPGVLKTRRLGYDGKGQAVIRSAADAATAWKLLGAAPLIYEELIPFDFEVSIIGARSTRGEVVVYPLNHNVHRAGMLRLTRAPFGSITLQKRAGQYLQRVLEHFRYAGVLNLEFFVCKGRLIANETAPRVHNSGHWTIEGAVTSQFENHLRAILGLPLGATTARGFSVMLNFIGCMPEAATLLRVPGLHWHDYGKRPRENRKLGHCTLVSTTSRQRDAAARALVAALDPASSRVWFPA